MHPLETPQAKLQAHSHRDAKSLHHKRCTSFIESSSRRDDYTLN